MDFTRHNEEVQQVWQAYWDGKPIRVPMVLTSVQRIWVLDPSLNRAGISWKEYLNDPEVMLEVSLSHRYHVAHHIPQDAEMGIPKNAWEISQEFGNVYEEAWLGCEIIYPAGQIAITRPRYAGDAKYEIFDRGIPGPFDGFLGQVREFYEYGLEKTKQMEYYGRPVHLNPPNPAGTDGPLTVANGIRGSELFVDMLEDEAYYHRLMHLVSDAIILHVKAWRSYLGHDPRPAHGWFADDAIQSLSTKMYREKVLPYHQRIFAALHGDGPHSIHLCGNVQRHLPTVIQSLNIGCVDTGFPINFNTLRQEVGEDVEIQGGVPVGDLVNGRPEEICEKTRAILLSGITQGGRFILKEANDLAPCTPLANLRAMYSAARKYGNFTQEGDL
jgi:uroporphyrinogen-III decarboxylase